VVAEVVELADETSDRGCLGGAVNEVGGAEARRTAEDKSKNEVMRCLKRDVARKSSTPTKTVATT
jgi:hypothetical protein